MSGNSSMRPNMTMGLNFSQIWISPYDLAGVTVAEVLADLNATSNIFAETSNWFH